MTDLLARFLVTPVTLSGLQKMLLLFPLCLSISVVYKATRCERLSELPAAVLSLWATIVIGMFTVGIGLWAVYLLVA